MITKFKIFENNETVSLAGQESFNIFLKVIDKFDNDFLKSKHYFDYKDYILFFHTDRIQDNSDIYQELSVLSSLEHGYKIFQKITNEVLSYYFGIKGNMCVYGFMDDNNKSHRIGEFQISTKFLRKLPKYKCFKHIYDLLSKININSLLFIQGIQKDFETFEQGKVQVINDRVIKMTIDRSQLPYTDEQLNQHIDYWISQQNWKRKVHAYHEIDHDKVIYYIKTLIEK